MCDPTKSGISGDPRLPFYSHVEKWSNKYATSLGCGGSYGHSFLSATIPELVHFDSVVVRDGVKGGSGGALHLQWDGSSSCYDPQVEATITQSRWLQLKRIYKLCDNDQAPKKGQDNYNPAYKYDYLFCCIVENMNAITRRADLDLCQDETTYATQAYGEAGTNLVLW